MAFRYKVSIHREVALERIRITSNRKIRSKFVCSLSRPIEWLVLRKISYNCLSKVRDCLLCAAIFHRGCYQSNRAWLTRWFFIALIEPFSFVRFSRNFVDGGVRRKKGWKKKQHLRVREDTCALLTGVHGNFVWEISQGALTGWQSIATCSLMFGSSRIRAGVQIYWIQTISIELRLCQEGYERIVIDDFQFEGIAVTRERVGAKSA